MTRRRGSAGYVIGVVFLGLIIFAFLFTVLTFAANQVNAFVSGMPSFQSSYDPNSNTAMDDLFFVGLGVMIAFGGIIEVINLSQKRKSGEEVI